jgi:predicted metal-dependent enzyme (double-stranded beta helix superfamily)
MFDKQRFIEDCIRAGADGPAAIREVVQEALSDRERLRAQMGEPEHAGVTAIYRSPDLTILNFVWAPYMTLMPHNHQMFSVIGIYWGREDNVFWRRTHGSIRPAGATSLGVGETAMLVQDVIHSVVNPIAKMTCAVHVYGGDFFAPPRPRSEWDHETLCERAWSLDRVQSVFRDAEARFRATDHVPSNPRRSGGAPL